MTLQLDHTELRILGCLIEKELTTPDYYPLTLNALTNACNQKSNRDPVVAYDETTAVRALDTLRHQGIAMQASGAGSRVPKYQHNLAAKLHLETAELAVLAELMLRGPQTLGELRTRASRMHPFGSLEEVEEVLDDLAARENPMVVQLPRQPGRKEHRYTHLLAGQPVIAEESATPPPEAATLQVRDEQQKIEKLEADLAELRKEFEALRQEMAEFKAQFE